MSTHSKILSQVQAVLMAEFPLLAGIDLQPDTPLLSAGYLDSFGVVTLLAALETAFKIELDVENLNLDQFENLNTISQLCINPQNPMK